MNRVLIIDPSQTIRAEMEFTPESLPQACLHFSQVATGAEALTKLGLTEFDLVLCHQQILTDDGPQIIQRISGHLSEGVVVLVGDQARGLLASKAQNSGAFDCLSSPIQPPELQLLLTRIGERINLQRKQVRLDHQIKQNHEERSIVAASETMIEVLEQLERASDCDVSALMTGEVGTRKGLMAQTVHAQSSRRSEPFIEAKCGQFKENEIEEKLFGPVPVNTRNQGGSKPPLIALADRGTLFLGQVEKLSIDLQRDLLRVIEDRELSSGPGRQTRHVDVRVIAATSVDLPAAVAEGRFDPKLYERLQLLTIQVPSLKERQKDIPLLVDQFMDHFRRSLGKKVAPLSSKALQRLCAYSWPGNTRELQNAIERAILLARGGTITLAHLPQDIVEDYRAPISKTGENFALRPARKAFETQLIVAALQATQGNRTRAARLLGISHRNLLYKLKAYSIRD